MFTYIGPLCLILAALLLIQLFWQTYQAIQSPARQSSSSNISSGSSSRSVIGVWRILLVLLLSGFGLLSVLIPISDGEVQGLNMNFIATMTVSSWIVLLILSIGARWWSLRQIGLIVFPFAAICFLLGLISMPVRLVSIEQIWPLEAHIWLSLVAYSFLCIAGIQAIFVWIKERSLKTRRSSGFIAGLPALAELEKTLFRLATLSYLWLSLALVTGFLFLENIYQQQVFHKVVLSVLAWILLSIFLLGHKTRGWRGSIAARWVVIALLLVVIGFAGSQLIYDVILISSDSVSR